MTIDALKEKKREFGFSYEELSERSGVPVPTIQKIFSGQTKSPRRSTLVKLEAALRGSVSYAEETIYQTDPAAENFLREEAAVYRTDADRNFGYTLDDYLSLPDERRVELIDGVFYDMASPTTIHQAIAMHLGHALMDFVLQHGGPCMPLASPVDVLLDQDNHTVVQPDVLIVCDRSRFQNGRIWGSPDFLVEILSPSTRKKDLFLKYHKYEKAGVRECWMIDPEKRIIVTYHFEDEEDLLPHVYGEKDSVPVMIWDGRCRVDFGEIFAQIDFLYKQ